LPTTTGRGREDVVAGVVADGVELAAGIDERGKMQLDEQRAGLLASISSGTSTERVPKRVKQLVKRTTTDRPG
jgi:hypothetical protein